jgi:hypothetical protein
MFGSMERLQGGKKVGGENHFPLFGCTTKREGNKVLTTAHIKILSTHIWTENFRNTPFFIEKSTNPLLLFVFFIRYF